MLIVIDNFLDKDDYLLYEIQNNKYWTNPLSYRFMYKDSSPTSVWERLSKKIWDSVTSYGVLPSDYTGIEYWNNIMSIPGDKQDLPWHFDKDEHLCNHISGEIKTPFVGSVYYAHKEIPSEGYLEIKRGEGLTDVERIQPVPNRLVIFDSGILHRVTPITSGIRRCFATNIWIDKPRDENFLT
jgi:hypothetical protein